MKKQFDIKYRPQIESGEYKVETRDGRKARIIDWDLNCASPIVAVMDAHIDLPGEIVDVFSVSGRAFDDLESPSDLFIVTPEEEPTEFEKCLADIISFSIRAGLPDNGDYEPALTSESIRFAKMYSGKLLTLARGQFIKDGYVIEKKAFHDAVKKVSPEVMKAVSENVDKANKELTEFEKVLGDIVKEAVEKEVGDNAAIWAICRGHAEKLLALAREELFANDTVLKEYVQMSREHGKAEALRTRATELTENLVKSGLDKDSIPYNLIEFMCNLYTCPNWKEIEEIAEAYATRLKDAAMKELPKWRKNGRGNNYSSETKFTINGRYLEMNDTLNDVYEAPLSALEKLPRLKEDEK